MNRRLFISSIIGLSIKPKFILKQKILCYNKQATIERIDTEQEKIFANSLIHAAMFGLSVIKEPFYLVRFDEEQKESDLFKDYDLDGYVAKIGKLNRKFTTILAPEMSITPA